MDGGQLIASNIDIVGFVCFTHAGGTVNNAGTVTLEPGGWKELTSSQQFGSLQLGGIDGAISTLTLPLGPCVINFANSSEQQWSNNAVLQIIGWSGSLNGGGQSQIIFENNGSGLAGLTSSQIAQIQFSFEQGTLPAKMLHNGEIIPDTSGPPFAPTDLGAAAFTNRINLTWTNNAISDTTYGIERSLDGTNFVQIAVTDTNATTYSDTNVTSGVRYYYRVVALGTGVNSAYSDVTSVTTKITPPIPGMIAWWRAEGAAEDAVGTHDGTTPWGGVTYPRGKIGKAFDFPGEIERVSIPDAPDFVLTNAFSIEGWIYPRQLTGFVTLRGDARWGHDAWTVHMDHIPGYLSFQIDDDSTNYVEIDAPVQTNQWQHFAATFDTTNGLQLYINGILAAKTNTTVVPVGVLDPTQDPSVGIGNSGVTYSDNFPFDGMIDELAIYSRVLTPTEIQNIYNTGSLGKLALTVPKPSMILNRETDGSIQLNFTGLVGHDYEFDISTDLVHWSSWQTQFNTSGTISVNDATATNYPMRFYRCVPLP
jgi:hypothetical protein